MFYCLTFAKSAHLLSDVYVSVVTSLVYCSIYFVCDFNVLVIFFNLYHLMSSNHFMEADMDLNKELIINYHLAPDVFLTLLIVTTLEFAYPTVKLIHNLI